MVSYRLWAREPIGGVASAQQPSMVLPELSDTDSAEIAEAVEKSQKTADALQALSDAVKEFARCGCSCEHEHAD